MSESKENPTSPFDPTPHNKLLIIGAGLGRTGTESLKQALEILLNGPCYHMMEVMNNQDQVAWLETPTPDWDGIFINRAQRNKGKNLKFLAAVDSPACNFYEQIMKKYPDALIILSLRKSPEEWAESVSSTIARASKLFKAIDTYTFGFITPIHNFVRLIDRMATVGGNYKPLYKLNKQELITYYTEWNDKVIRTVPKDKLIIYKVGDGWAPLCNRLNLPIPNVAYPHSNQREGFMQRVHVILSSMIGKFIGSKLIFLTVVSVAVYGGYKYSKTK